MNIRRRLLLASTAWPALAWTNAARAQAKPPVLIGWLNSSARATNLFALNAFNEGMAALGWKLGVHYVVEERWADGHVDRLPALAQELAAKKPVVIVATATTSATVASKAAPTTPVVLASGDPMSTGLVKSLARPGGMVTGTSNVNNEINQKMIELLVESLPNVRRIGIFADASLANHDDYVKIARSVAERFRVVPIFSELKKPEDIEPVITKLAKEKVQALVLSSSAWFSAHRQQILKLALTQRWPVVGNQLVFAEAGALFSYGAERVALYRRAAYSVDRILKGTKPAELPVEQPTKFELVLNMKTAKMLGITFPQTILVRADKVIE